MRVTDWPEKLHAFIAARREVPFKWGENDCCLFAADTVQVLTGVDHARDFRGTYATENEAATVLAEKGCIRTIATAALGAEIDPKLAQRGDVVLLKEPQGLGICLGRTFAGSGTTGLRFFTLDDILTAWRVD